MSNDIILTNEVQWQDFDVRPNHNYILIGTVENEVAESLKPSLLVLKFEDKKLSHYDVEFNRLLISKKYGYYKYLPQEKGENFFSLSLKFPSGISRFSVGFVLFQNTSTVKFKNLKIIKNYSADIFMHKNIITSKNSLNNYHKRIIFRDRWLKAQQQNILFKNTLAYKVTNSISMSKESIKKRFLLPWNLLRVFLGYIKHKRHKLRINVWRGLSKTSINHSISIKNGERVKIQGRYFTLSDEKKNSIILIYDLDMKVSEQEMKTLGFNYSNSLGYFNYINVTGEGEQSFTKDIFFPSQVKKVTFKFRTWHNLKPILLKVTEVSTYKPQKKDKNKKVKLYDDTLSEKEITSLIGWKQYPNPNNRPTIMAVMDEFTTGCFEDEVCLIQPRPDNWLALIKTYKPSLVFIESAWKGNFGSWQYRVADYSNKPGDEIEQISQYCKQKNIPIIFWNKEDPVHHQKFMCSAKLATHIFTTDANMIESYKKNTNCKKVFSLPFAAQPTLHKPKSLKNRINKSCFAGSWYGNRHAERGEAMKWLLEAANEYGLDIFDRNFGSGIFPFPEQYKEGIKGSLPYKELCDKYSKYRVFLNVNSVTNSPTMFSRRVFELMASGTPIVSTYAKGIEKLFDTDAVWLVHTKEEALHAIKTLMTDDKEWRRRSLLGIREVFSKHTYSHRLNYIFKSTGLNNKINIEPKIVLLTKITSETELEQINEFIKSQNYKNIIIYVEYSSNNIKSNIILNKNINLCKNLKEIINTETDCKAIGWIDTDIKYGSYYIQDLLNATVYEPSANGWAKSINDDHFTYNQVTLLSASIWRPEIFLNQYFKRDIQNNVQHEKLFIIDSNEYINDKKQGIAK